MSDAGVPDEEWPPLLVGVEEGDAASRVRGSRCGYDSIATDEELPVAEEKLVAPTPTIRPHALWTPSAHGVTVSRSSRAANELRSRDPREATREKVVTTCIARTSGVQAGHAPEHPAALRGPHQLHDDIGKWLPPKRGRGRRASIARYDDRISQGSRIFSIARRSSVRARWKTRLTRAVQRAVRHRAH